jgi:hypothetical protein
MLATSSPSPSSYLLLLFPSTTSTHLLQFITHTELWHYSTFSIQEQINPFKMLDPVGFEAAFYKTSSLLVPTPSPTPSVSPIPPVLPNKPYYEEVGETGSKTLWVSLSHILFLHF